MQLRIRARCLDVSPEIRRAIERNVRLMLGRHAVEIERTQVTLSPSEPAREGNRCRIHVRLRRGERLAVEAHADDPCEAAAAAVWRLEHRLDRRRVAGPPPRRAGSR